METPNEDVGRDIALRRMKSASKTTHRGLFRLANIFVRGNVVSHMDHHRVILTDTIVESQKGRKWCENVDKKCTQKVDNKRGAWPARELWISWVDCR